MQSEEQTNPPLRAHLLRAAHAWCTDYGHTPYLQVLVDEHVQVPLEHVQDGVIVLNISFDSTNKLHIGDEWITFQARFNGAAREIMVPIDHVINLFSRQTQESYQAMTAEEFLAIQEGRYKAPEAAAAPADDASAAPAEPAVATDTTAKKKSGIVRIK